MAVEDMFNDTFSANAFCGLRVEDTVPDHSTLSRFRNELSEKRVMNSLLKALNAQLERLGIEVRKGGGIINASITPTACQPHGKAPDLPAGKLDHPIAQQAKSGLDPEARWMKKGNKLQYGYKRHYLAADQTGLVLSVHITSANVHDGQCIAACLDQVVLPSGSRLLADKGYFSAKNDELLRQRGLRSGIQRKAYRNRPLSVWEKRYNRLMGCSCYKIERVFGSIKRWFGRLSARYLGLAKTHGQHVLEAIAYNLYRLPGIVAPSVIKTEKMA